MEEERTYDPVPDDFDQGSVVRFLRDVPPAHYSVKIESFSKLVGSGIERCMSSMFDAGGYTWRLILYPNGNTKRGGEGHISLYLAIDKTDSLPRGWEAYVTFRMFVYNHHKDKYLTIQDESVHQLRRFHRAKKECGFDRLISLDIFNAATNGYLIDDSCVFGVEVYEVKNSGSGEIIKIFDDPKKSLSIGKSVSSPKFAKKNFNFSQRISLVERVNVLYPNGDGRCKDNLSSFIQLVESPASWKKVSAEFSVVIKNEKSDCHKRTGKEMWFSTDATELTSGASSIWGWADFMLLSDLTSKSSGFIVNDTILLQAKVKIKTEVTSFS